MIEKNQESGEIVIDLRKLLLVYWRNWWIILLCGVIAAGVSLLYTRVTVTPMYRATVSVYVNNMKNTQDVNSITAGTLSAAQQLVNTYVNIIRSDRVLTKALEELRMDGLTTDRLRGIMSATQVETTEIFYINVTHPNPEAAAEIANVLAQVSPAEIAAVVEGSSAQIIDYAQVPVRRYSPSYRRSTLLGGAVGALAAAAFVTLRFLLDVRIKDEEDLTQLFTIPVLGQIPSFSQSGTRRSGYESSSSRHSRHSHSGKDSDSHSGESDETVPAENSAAPENTDVLGGV